MLMAAVGVLLLLLVLSDFLRGRLHRRDSLAGQLVLVTGAAGGLGRQVVLECLRAGAVVACWDMREDALDGLREWLVRDQGMPESSVRCKSVDVADASGDASMAQEWKTQFSRRVFLLECFRVCHTGEL